MRLLVCLCALHYLLWCTVVCFGFCLLACFVLACCGLCWFVCLVGWLVVRFRVSVCLCACLVVCVFVVCCFLNGDYFVVRLLLC